MPAKAMVIDLAKIDQLFAAAARANALNLIQDLQVNDDGTVALTGDGSRYASIRADAHRSSWNMFNAMAGQGPDRIHAFLEHKVEQCRQAMEAYRWKTAEANRLNDRLIADLNRRIEILHAVRTAGLVAAVCLPAAVGGGVLVSVGIGIAGSLAFEVAKTVGEIRASKAVVFKMSDNVAPIGQSALGSAVSEPVGNMVSREAMHRFEREAARRVPTGLRNSMPRLVERAAARQASAQSLVRLGNATRIAGAGLGVVLGLAWIADDIRTTLTGSYVESLERRPRR